MLRHLLALLLMPAVLCAAVPRTLVNGSLNLPSGTNPAVTLKLTPSEPFVVMDGGGDTYQVLSSVTYNVSNSGALFMYVVPNTGSANVPDYTTYAVEVSSGSRVVANLTWRVPTSALTVSAGSLIATPSATVTPTAALPLAGGTLVGPVTLWGSGVGLRWPPLASAPTPLGAGSTYISSVDYALYIYNGTSWVAPTGINSVTHYSELTGNGTPASPLRITPGAVGSVMLTVTGGNTVTATALTGDVTVSGAGVTAIGALKVVGGMVATVPDDVTNETAATDMTLTPKSDEVILPANKYARITGQSGEPATFNTGGFGFDTAKRAHISRQYGFAGGTVAVGGMLHPPNTASLTAITATSETDWSQTYTLPAGYFVAGKRLRVYGSASYTATGANIRTKLKFGSVTIIDTLANGAGTATNRQLTYDYYVTCRTAGVSGTLFGDGVFTISGSSLFSGIFSPDLTSAPAAQVVDTTGALIIKFTSFWSASSQTLTPHAFTVEAVN